MSYNFDKNKNKVKIVKPKFDKNSYPPHKFSVYQKIEQQKVNELKSLKRKLATS